MIYIYDVLLNLNNELYDFYEWEKTDELNHIKKIPVFKVSKKVIKDILNNNIQMDKEFINKSFNLTEVYTPRKVSKINYAFILSDGDIAIAIKTDKEGNVKEKSSMLIEEEEEILMLIKKLNGIDLKYVVKDKIQKKELLTRYEVKIKNFLEKEIKDTYKLKDKDKLKYLYTEYFNKDESNINLIYNELLLSLNDINDNHRKIYSLLQLITNKN